MFIYLSLPGLFDRSLKSLASPVNRHLCATNKKHVRNYIREMHKYFQEHLVLQRLEDIKAKVDHSSAEKIDHSHNAPCRAEMHVLQSPTMVSRPSRRHDHTLHP
jgi:hypothetical protein